MDPLPYGSSSYNQVKQEPPAPACNMFDIARRSSLLFLQQTNTILTQVSNVLIADMNLTVTRKITALRVTFSSSCGGLQPLAATVGPFGPNNSALWAQLKMLKINLENLAEICLKFFLKSALKFLRKSVWKFLRKSIWKILRKSVWKILRKSIWKIL